MLSDVTLIAVPHPLNLFLHIPVPTRVDFLRMSNHRSCPSSFYFVNERRQNFLLRPMLISPCQVPIFQKVPADDRCNWLISPQISLTFVSRIFSSSPLWLWLYIFCHTILPTSLYSFLSYTTVLVMYLNNNMSSSSQKV